ncbi:MAG: hypothetical protein WD990_13355 [Acidimicrobiia bacterium]
MKRFAVALMCFLLPAAAAHAQEELAVSTLLAQPDVYNQQIVTIRGEIVGDYGDRGDVVWVQLNDDPYVDQPFAEEGRLAGTNTGISVRLNGGVPAEFGPPGGYGIRGPIIEVTGVFRDLDPELGGLTFVEATAVALVSPAEAFAEPGPDTAAAVTGATLTAIALLAMAHRRDLLRRLTRSYRVSG